ncbi:MAG TPA: cysteine--tRNA ligase, partial [Bacteroidales bacterium]|nr:cysteine--tRNA ligase [Bacteroidales bacterium]
SVRYWIHNNMITINGQKMARSLGNFITLDEVFNGKHPLLEQPYSPMTVRFFILQAHYRSTLDFSNEALKGAEKGLERLMKAAITLDRLKPSTDSTVNVDEIKAKCYEALDDDLNSPVLLAQLFEAVRLINSAREGTEKMTASDIAKMKELFSVFVKDILGLIDESAGRGNEKIVSGLMKLILDIRHEARQKKDFATSDKIREELSRLGITVRDLKDGAEWEFE